MKSEDRRPKLEDRRKIHLSAEALAKVENQEPKKEGQMPEITFLYLSLV